MKKLIPFLLFSCMAFLTSAQTLSSKNNTLFNSVMTASSEKNTVIFKDSETNTFYIDFQKLKFNVAEIFVQNNNNNAVLQKQVTNLPVDTIFELDLNTFPKGDYNIILRSTTQEVKYPVSLK